VLSWPTSRSMSKVPISMGGKCWTFGSVSLAVLSLAVLSLAVVYGCQGIARLDNWIAQSRLQSNLMDWIVIDNPKSKSDFGF